MAGNSGSDGFRHFMGYLVLPAASALGFYGTAKLARDNGLTDFMLQAAKQTPSYLPGLNRVPIKQWTGSLIVDRYFQFFVAFFWPVITSQKDVVQLQSRHFIGQFVAMWTLLELEGVRSGGGSGLGTLLTGLSIQNVGAATTVPLYAAIQLISGRSSRKVASPGGVEESRRLRAIPIAVTLGVLAPLGLMTFSKSPEIKQFGIVCFQIYPIFTAAIARLVAPLLPSEQAVKRKAGDSLPGPLSTVYIFATAVATVTHLASISEALSKGVPLLDIFLPRLTLSNPSDRTEAALNFLRWDEAVTSASFLLWSLSRYALDTAPARGVDVTAVVQASMAALVRTVLMGPIGAATELLRQREIAKV